MGLKDFFKNKGVPLTPKLGKKAPAPNTVSTDQPPLTALCDALTKAHAKIALPTVKAPWPDQSLLAPSLQSMAKKSAAELDDGLLDAGLTVTQQSVINAASDAAKEWVSCDFSALEEKVLAGQEIAWKKAVTAMLMTSFPGQFFQVSVLRDYQAKNVKITVKFLLKGNKCNLDTVLTLKEYASAPTPFNPVAKSVIDLIKLHLEKAFSPSSEAKFSVSHVDLTGLTIKQNYSEGAGIDVMFSLPYAHSLTQKLSGMKGGKLFTLQLRHGPEKGSTVFEQCMVLVFDTDGTTACLKIGAAGAKAVPPTSGHLSTAPSDFAKPYLEKTVHVDPFVGFDSTVLFASVKKQVESMMAVPKSFMDAVVPVVKAEDDLSVAPVEKKLTVGAALLLKSVPKKLL